VFLAIRIEGRLGPPAGTVAVESRGRRGLTGGPMTRSTGSIWLSMCGSGEAGDHSELELEPGESDLKADRTIHFVNWLLF